jgi:hypothetical protein
MPENNQENIGKIPKFVENQLIEHTLGGFMLFYFNTQTGQPEQLMSFDSPAHSLGLQKYITDWNEAVHAVNFESSVHAIQNILNPSGSDESDEDDDDRE